MKNLKKLIKGEKPGFYDLAEEVAILGLIIGALLLVAGIILSAFAPAGFAALSAMLGALLSFLSLIFMAILWFAKDGFR
ncbi:MAG: hypothetical protein HYT71_03695 [Candidatus Aenigmarchaeota archaeon]|nr:hypothetical protein [Candidatus Aenigmarchaeota archaeon]